MASRIRRLFILMALVVLVLSAAPAAFAAVDDLPPGGTFVDDDLLPEEGYIEAIADVGITRGCNPPANDKFCPERILTRGEMASIFVRALDLPSGTPGRFSDTADSVHRAEIDALAAAGITRGCNPPENTAFCPDRRVTRGEMAAFITRAQEDFEVVEHSDRAAMEEAVKQGKARHTFGVYTGGKFYTFTLRDESLMDRLIEGHSSDWKRLDVAILHAAILERLLGIDATALEEQRNITYTRDPDAAIVAVDSGVEQIFFLLNPTRPQEVIRVADHGEKMPQKSTDFYPKLLTGLVLSKLEIEKNG